MKGRGDCLRADVRDTVDSSPEPCIRASHPDHREKRRRGLASHNGRSERPETEQAHGFVGASLSRRERDPRPVLHHIGVCCARNKVHQVHEAATHSILRGQEGQHNLGQRKNLFLLVGTMSGIFLWMQVGPDFIAGTGLDRVIFSGLSSLAIKLGGSPFFNSQSTR